MVTDAPASVFVAYTQPNTVKKLSEAGKAQLKLEADYLNSIAVSVMAFGVVAALISYVLGAPGSASSAPVLLLIVLVCFALSVGVHTLAHIRLRELDG